MSNEVTQGVSNYLVPATGSPNAYVIKNTFTASPQSVNFQNIQLNGLAFRPSGVIIDNTKSASPLKVLIPEMSFNISCPAGASLNMPYPAPMNHTASITGAGDAEATVIFVDYPLQPYSSAQAAGSPPIPNPLPVSVPNPLPVTGPATNAEIRATPVPVAAPNPLPVSNSTTTVLYVTLYDVSLGGTFVYAIATGVVYLAVGIRSLRIENIGAANGTFNGVVIKPGATIEFNGGLFGSNQIITIDGTGTELAYTSVTY